MEERRIEPQLRTQKVVAERAEYGRMTRGYIYRPISDHYVLQNRVQAHDALAGTTL